MSPRRSLDDTCNIFLSRRGRGRSPLTHSRTSSQSLHCGPPLRPENLTIPPSFLLPRHLEVPDFSATALTRTSESTSSKPLPLPGSSGITEPKPTRLPNGRSHVPRPRNPFIFFRCDLVHQRKTLPRSDLDDTNISRIAGDLWRDMTPAQKKPWVELAAQEKARHALLYPDYKYAPTHSQSGSKTKKANNVALEERPPRQVLRMGMDVDMPASLDRSPLAHPHPNPNAKSRRQADRPRPYHIPMPRRRSSSCPPAGAVPVLSHSPLDDWTPTLVTCDDTPIQRRPSRTVMYQSVTHLQAQPAVMDPSQIVPAPATIYDYHHPQPIQPQSFNWLGIDTMMQDSAYPILDLTQSPDPYPVPGLACFDNKHTYIPSASDPGFALPNLAELERLTLGGATFTDPFSTLGLELGPGMEIGSDMGPGTVPGTSTMARDSPYLIDGMISPLDCSEYSTDSPCSSNSGNMFSN